MALSSEFSQPVLFYPKIIVTHDDDAKDRLLEQYKDAPNIETLIQSLMTEQIQGLEDVIEDLVLNRFDIDIAEGDQLDRIGVIVGQNRNGQSDVTYRLFLKGRIGVNASMGLIEDIITIVKNLTGSTITEVTELFPATVNILYDVAIPSQYVSVVRGMLQDALAAGVELGATGVFPASDTFRFGGLPGPTISARGFGNVAGTGNGGKFYGTQ